MYFTKEHFMHLREVMAPLSVKLLYGLCTLACGNYVKNIKRRVPCLASPRLASAAISTAGTAAAGWLMVAGPLRIPAAIAACSR